MSQTERSRALRQKTSGQRSRSRSSSKQKSVTEASTILGGLVAGERARLGLTQSQLAARIHTSRSKVARIEQGQTPDAETQRRLSRALNPERGPLRRMVARVAALRWLGVPHGSRWLWSGAAAVVLISMLVVLEGRSSNPGSSTPQATIARLDALGVPSATNRAGAQAKEAVAARIAAGRAASAPAGNSLVDEVHRGLPDVSDSVTEPGSPSSGGGGGGGGSGPDLTDHGVGSNGGNVPQGAAPAPPPAPEAVESGGGGSTPAPRPNCLLPGLLC